MRITPFLALALPAVATAQQQIPLFDQVKGWFDQAASYLNTAVSNTAGVASEKVAQAAVTSLTWENWRSTLAYSGRKTPGDPPEPWMVYITGNTTCKGRCGRVDSAWNQAATSLVADPSAPKLASIDCDSQEILCGAFSAAVSTVWYILVPHPAPAQSPAATHITIHRLNRTTVTSEDITNIHTKKLYLEKARYEGQLHPFDGWVARYGLTSTMAVVLYYMSKVPNWAFMIGLSLFSRYFVSRRMPPPAPRSGAAGAAPAGAAPANARPAR